MAIQACVQFCSLVEVPPPKFGARVSGAPVVSAFTVSSVSASGSVLITIMQSYNIENMIAKLRPPCLHVQ